MKLWQKILFVLALFFYIYFRIVPIIHQIVPYTYDQGRDFLKVKEIVENKKLTFIGPTTGLEGIFHGVWIYYFLTIPYILFNGNPIGFYYFLFLVNLIFILWFFIFIKKKFNSNLALLFLLIVSSNKYFVTEAFSPSNDHLASLFILLFIYFSYQYFSKKRKIYLFLTALFAGFIFESEVAFGLFLIPATFITFLLIEKKEFFKKIHFFILGLMPASLPRILFEIKNNFLQTKNFIKYLITINQFSINWQQILSERFNLFFNYLNDIFNFQLISIIIFLLIIFILITTNNFKKTKNNWLKFSLLALLIIFILTLIYKKTPFYPYYLNGIQYFYLSIILLILNNKNNLTKFIITILLVFFFIHNLVNFKNSLMNKKIPLLGLRADNQIINYFVKNEPNDYFCLRIYTPPVIPYTYQYLLSYYAKMEAIKYPKGEFYKNRCYFIIDKELYQFRVDKWRQENTPRNAKLIKKITFENGSNIEIWEKK